MKKIAVFLIPAVLVLLNSCATSLQGIKEDPDRYAGKDVYIRAEVELEAPIPFLGYSLYKIGDQSDTMFLFTDKKYVIGQMVSGKVRVIGINEQNSKDTAERVARQTADFLVEHRIRSEADALTFSRKLIRLISTLGSIAEGSYFLIAE